MNITNWFFGGDRSVQSGSSGSEAKIGSQPKDCYSEIEKKVDDLKDLNQSLQATNRNIGAIGERKSVISGDLIVKLHEDFHKK